MIDKVFIEKQETYEYEELKQKVRHLLDAMQIEQKITRDTKVVIKPNLVMAKKPEDAATTHPFIVKAVCEIIRPLTKKIIIAECPGGPNNKMLIAEVYRATGIKAIADELGIEICLEPVEVEVDLSEHAKNIRLAKVFLEADLIINLPKLKTHGLTLFSGAIKNLYGTVVGIYKTRYHYQYKDKEKFTHFLLDICEHYKPAINIMDGIFGMEGEGPTAGTPRKVGLLLGSTNPYYLDIVSSSVIGIDANRVDLFVYAKKRGIVETIDIKEILKFTNLELSAFYELRVAGYKLPLVREALVKHRLPKWLQAVLKKILEPKPKVLIEKCIGCGRCVTTCPAKTIKLKDKKAVIDYKDCIKCYCCQELCPQKAIILK